MQCSRVTSWTVKHMLNLNNALLTQPLGCIFPHLCTFGSTFCLCLLLALLKYIYALWVLHLCVIFGWSLCNISWVLAHLNNIVHYYYSVISFNKLLLHFNCEVIFFCFQYRKKSLLEITKYTYALLAQWYLLKLILLHILNSNISKIFHIFHL